MSNYVVAGAKSWSRQIFEQIIVHYPGNWHFVGGPQDLAALDLTELAPTYIFFLHWSWKVPISTVKKYECVCFHMTDVPYGRGGSPLQNLIVRGHRTTKLTALRMVEDFDAGPVYCKEDLSLEGGAEEIYMRAAHLSARMVGRIVSERIVPVPQVGEPVIFKRRTLAESRLPELTDLDGLYDFIRMLDADGYPRAFIEHAGFRFEFSRAGRYHERIVADVVITPVARGKS